MICFLMFYFTYSIMYLIQTDNNILENGDFVRLYKYEYKNIYNIYNFDNDIYFLMYSDSFPQYLYKYNSIVNIEDDHYISIDNEIIISEGPYENSKEYFMQNNPIWNLDRSDQRSNILDEQYIYPTYSGKDTDVYVLDTGIDIVHPEFEGRAIWGFNAIDNNNVDCNSHGTHVAGTIGSKTHGIAKNSNLIAVKVMGCDGGGSYSSVIGGLEYVLKQHSKSKNPSIVNMSLGGPKSDILNNIISKLVQNNIHIIVAAGNSNLDACESSPSNSPDVFTVGATTKNNEIAGFSNWGKCVDILAPGTEILSTIPDNKTAILQGTSMASPLQAGIHSLILSYSPELTPSILNQILKIRCTKNMISKLKENTPNCLSYSLS